MKKRVAFTLISFAVLKWHECLSFQLPFELTVEILVQLHLELEVKWSEITSSQRNWKGKGTDETPHYPLPNKHGDILIFVFNWRFLNLWVEISYMYKGEFRNMYCFFVAISNLWWSFFPTWNYVQFRYKFVQTSLWSRNLYKGVTDNKFVSARSLKTIVGLFFTFWCLK